MGVIVDNTVSHEILEVFKEHKINVFKSKDIDFLYNPVNTHPDMQIHFVDDHTAICAPCTFDYYKNILPKSVNLIKGNQDMGLTYPKDCAYNVARMGKKVIGNLSYVDSKIIELYQSLGFWFIDVKQGYTKCNLSIIDENSVITEDEGLFKTLSENGVDVLKISSGFVSLTGFKNGFIGGASGFICPKCIAFFGNINTHPDYLKIKDFITKKRVKIINLSNDSLFDLGSILYFDDSFSVK